MVLRSLACKKEGLPEEDLEVPLGEEEHNKALDDFERRYSWLLPALKMVCDTLLGRIRREFLAWAVNMYKVTKVKSIASTGKVETQRKRIAEGVPLEWVGPVPDEEPHRESPAWCKQYRLLSNCRAVAGNFEVDYAPEGQSKSTRVLFCHWMDADYYSDIWEARMHKLLESASDAVVFQSLTELEELTRTKAIELVRRKKSAVPWGIAIRMGLQLTQEEWSDTKTEVRNPGTGRKRQRSPKSTQGQKAPKQPANQRKEDRPQFKYTQKGANGDRVCVFWNSKAGCKKGDSCLAKHVCDVMLKGSKKACSGSHKRFNHDTKKHGAAEVVQ